jgi:predicted AlkP superfamily phosphohydrolase/phosphomutase
VIEMKNLNNDSDIKNVRPNDRKMAVIGLDGACWDILMPLVKKGRAPNIAGLMSEGVYGQLQSLEPMMSPVIWTSIGTGKGPAKHGVKSFYSRQDSLRALRVWEILAEFGRTVGIFEWLVTSPPRPLKEFVIPGWLATDTATYPPDLAFIKKMDLQGREREKNVAAYFELAFKGLRYGLRWVTLLRTFVHVFKTMLMRPDFYDVHYKSILLKMDLHGDFAAHLLKRYKPEFSAVVFYGTDQIPHHYWKFMDHMKFDDIPKEDISKFSGIIRKTYESADQVLGRILNALSDDTTIIVVSDHGMEPVTDVKFVFKVDELIKYLDFGPKEKLLVQILGNNLFFGIDESEDNKKRRLQENLVAALKKIWIVQLYDGLFNVHFDGSEHIVAITRSPDLHLTDYLIKFSEDNVVDARSIIQTKHLLSAKHSKNGIVIIKGKNIAKDRRLQPHSILDITPTILALKGLPVAEDMDGYVIEEAFEDNFFERNPVDYIDSYESLLEKKQKEGSKSWKGTLTGDEREKVKERLRDLGYFE